MKAQDAFEKPDMAKRMKRSGFPMPLKDYYIIENVWHRVTQDLEKDIVRFWTTRNALTGGAEAAERVKQVVFVARNLDGSIAGLCTVKRSFSERLNNFVYLYRTMIDQGHRRHGLAMEMFIKTRDFLEDRFVKGIEPETIGILVTVQNEDIGATFRHAIWPRTGLIFIGFNRKGHQVRIYYFKDAEI